MFCPIILGSDKTTVLVATGQNQYYPLYMSLGPIRNNVRRAHRDAVALIGFLAIPKGLYDLYPPLLVFYKMIIFVLGKWKDSNSKEFRHFRRQLFHASLSAILKPLHAAMSHPEVRKCPDGHFQCVIYGLGPYIADYPEQVLVSCIVQNWCPTCPQNPKEWHGGVNTGRRSRDHTEALIEGFDHVTLWEDWGSLVILL